MSITLNGTTGIDTPSVSANTVITNTVSASNIVGQVCFFAMQTPPEGFLACDGSAVSRTTYAALFAAIGTLYGSGNGTTTFNLPDLRGEFVRGWDNGRGIDSGRSFGTTQTDAMQGHKHNTSRLIAMRAGSDSNVDYFSQTASVNDAELYDLAGQMLAAPVSDGTNGTPRTAAETRPRNVALLACIKV
jgi:microcystin-dependent protein